jgi:hypothetical protein
LARAEVHRVEVRFFVPIEVPEAAEQAFAGAA